MKTFVISQIHTYRSDGGINAGLHCQHKILLESYQLKTYSTGLLTWNAALADAIVRKVAPPDDKKIVDFVAPHIASFLPTSKSTVDQVKLTGYAKLLQEKYHNLGTQSHHVSPVSNDDFMVTVGRYEWELSISCVLYKYHDCDCLLSMFVFGLFLLVLLVQKDCSNDYHDCIASQ